MNEFSLVLRYSWRLLARQWRYFSLSFVSLLVTGVVMMLILLLTSASSSLLADEARDLLGGDVTIESSSPINSTEVLAGLELSPAAISEQLTFNATLESEAKATAFSVRAVDQAFPLYGEFVLAAGTYRALATNEIYLDQLGAERLAVGVGDWVSFGAASYQVVGIVTKEPTSLLTGFRFLPSAILSLDGFAASNLEPALLRVEYSLALRLPSSLTSEQTEALKSLEVATGRVLDVDIAGEERGGLQFGLNIVTEFLIVAVLITAVLAAVNVYASTLYLVTMERKSFAILVALGLRKRSLIVILGLALFYVVVLASLLGAGLGTGLFSWSSSWLGSTYQVVLPSPDYVFYGLISLALVVATAYGSFGPAIRKSLTLKPRQLLLGESDEPVLVQVKTLLIITGVTLLPLFALATFLLESLQQGFLIMLAILAAYVVVAGIFYFCLYSVYRQRHRFGFTLRSIIAHKKADGLFGIVSFTSLFAALTALGTLALVQVSIEAYLEQDLNRTLPTTYVLDVQPSQAPSLKAAFPELDLFASIPARLLEIDGVRIQEEIAAGNETIDRELGREFNLTGRAELLASESLTAGEWSAGESGEISVDQEFAERANIELGSAITFSIQGFPVSGTVTSLRETDSRSGLPFFYFVLAPQDVADFPSVYFGYSYQDEAAQTELGRFLAANMPNVTLIETQSVGPLVTEIIQTLLLMVLIVTLPPLLIATLLIATLVVSSYGPRRREGARLRALGATKNNVFWWYILETCSLTVAAAVVSYLLSVLLAWLVTSFFLGLDSFVWFDLELFVGLYLIIVFVVGIAWYLFKTDTMPLRELLAYENTR